MQKIFRWIQEFAFPPFTIPLVLLALCLISFGLMIPWLGFYWDDLPFIWISQHLGPEALTQYFSTKRPVLGLLYQFTTSLIGITPWRWHVFGLFWRWANAVALWWLIRLIWPKRENLAARVSFLFVIYPGFDQQFIPIAYAHYFITLTAFFLSLGFTMLSIYKPKSFWLFTALALFASAANLFTTEYFFLLDLLRAPLIWIGLRNVAPDNRTRVRQTLRIWLPYLALFFVPTLWRLFFFQFQTYSYHLLLFQDFKAQPVQTILQLIRTIGHDIWLTTFGAWAKAFEQPTLENVGQINLTRYWLIVVVVAGSLTTYLLKTGRAPSEENSSQRLRDGIEMILIGAFGLLISGWPFWLTKLPLALSFPNSRFTLPFMLGVSLFIAGLLQILPGWQWAKIVLLSIAVGFAVGLHFQIALDYRRDWGWHKELIWKMVWRMPRLEPGTLIIGNYLPGTHFSDNSLTAPLNHIYAPENRSEELYYMFYYPSVRYGRQIKSWEKDQPIKHDYLVGLFHGNTSQTVTIYHRAPDCLRILDPEIDTLNPALDELMRGAATLSTTAPILPAGDNQGAIPIPEIYGAEPEHTWCYYYEKADLSRQLKDWDQLITLGEEAFEQGYGPGDPDEWIPFIEGHAHVGNWEEAIKLTQESSNGQPERSAMLCKLWERIDNDLPPGDEKDAAFATIQTELGCR